MPNSTVTLQNVVDYVSTIGDLMAQLPAGGFSNLQALGLANDVIADLISKRFNWKFNRLVVTPFLTNSLQQDYCTIATKNIGWVESAAAVDINNSALPKPISPVLAVQDIELTSMSLGKPVRVCWMPNDQLVQGTWPGATQTYTNPLGAATTPYNPPTNIKDANGNILILTTYGVTGLVAPVLAASSPSGTTVNDGTCVWTVADPKAQGFRIWPLPPQRGTTYQVNVFAQARAPRFTVMSQVLDPLPDDYEHYFKQGYIAHCTKHSTAPVVRARATEEIQLWLKATEDACKQGDRETSGACITPESSIMDPNPSSPIDASWPFQP
jgi:hypothetical protein